MRVTTDEGLTFEGSVEEYRKFIALGEELYGGKPEEEEADTLENNRVTYRKVCEDYEDRGSRGGRSRHARI